MQIGGLPKISANIAARLVATFVMVACFSHVTFWFDSYQQDVVITPYTLYGVIGAAGLFFLGKPKALIPFLKSDFVKWAGFTILVLSANYLRLLNSSTSAADVGPAIDKLQLFIPALAFAYIAFSVPQDYFKFGIGVVAIIAPLSLVFDFSQPDLMHPNTDKSTSTNLSTSSRVSAFWLNPNAASEALILTVVLASRFYSSKFLAVAYTLAGIAIALSGSRAGLVAYVGLGGYLIFFKHLPRTYLVVPILVALSFGALIAYFEDTATDLGRGQGIEDSINRLNVLSGESESDGSSDARETVARDSYAESFDNPIFGHGYQYIDPTFLVGTHNLPLDLAFQYGLFGLAIWIGLLIILYRAPRTNRFPNIAFGLFLWFSFFSHNIIEPNVWYVFIALTLFFQPQTDEGPTVPKRKIGRKKRGGDRPDGVARAQRRYRF